jgi:hypothetical protein
MLLNLFPQYGRIFFLGYERTVGCDGRFNGIVWLH